MLGGDGCSGISSFGGVDIDMGQNIIADAVICSLKTVPVTAEAEHIHMAAKTTPASIRLNTVFILITSLHESVDLLSVP